MRRFNILFAFAFILLTSCFTDEVDYVGYQPSSKGGIHIVGAVEEYDIKSVGTRADDNGIADSYISEMTMFIFKSNGDLIQGYTDVGLSSDNECTSAINIQRGNPTFLIDTEEGILADLSGGSDTDIVYYDNNADDLGACDIYIVANAWHQLSAGAVGSRPVDAIKKLADLEAFVYQADATLAMPADGSGNVIGFPMIGKQQGASFNLHKKGNNEGNAVATIPLKKLYSKVRFTMQINADQVVAGQTPKFTISKVEVFNVPKMARLGRQLEDGELVYKDYTEEMGYEDTYTPSGLYYYTNTTEDDPPFVIDQFNKKTIYHSTSSTTDDIIEFGFYMPEHKVTPNTITYPENITDDAKQYYKPAGVGQSRNGDGTTSNPKIATFVRIHGSYTDHNGQILGVSYDIYLGQNNSDDFTIKRNQLLNNKLIITGLTNHKGAYPDAEGNISIDHRVEVADRGFNLSMERTAILDAHFEVRPLDIELQPGATMTVTIPDAYKSWVAMEDDAVASGNTSGLYVNTTTARKGVRKYFTTNLVKELNAAASEGTTGNGGTITFKNNEATTQMFRIWFYIDENPNVYDKLDLGKQTSETGTYSVSKEQYRVCPVQFVYNGTKVVKDEVTGEDVTVDVTKEETINFQQWNLWRVWSADGNRYYDIEHEEEYLNNYASDMQYGQTQDGMPWGLDNINLSHIHDAAILTTDEAGDVAKFIDMIGKALSWFSLEAMYNNSFSKLEEKPYYDFYLSGDTDNGALTVHDYTGYHFNEDIIKYLLSKYLTNDKAKLNGVLLTEDVKSAISYCYNKNKRDKDGNVCTLNADGELISTNLKWYMPSIDEIEEIAMGAYDEFDKVFQKEFYWSCQPAYELRKLEMGLYASSGKESLLNPNFGPITADYYVDDIDRARSTSVEYVNSKYQIVSSGVPGYAGTQYGRINWDTPVMGTYTPKTLSFTDYPGNKARTESCRIRAVYRSGTK